MAQATDPKIDINSWLEDELYQQYLHDRKTVDDSWKHLFEENGSREPETGGNGSGTSSTTPQRQIAAELPETRALAAPQPAIEAGPAEQLALLRGPSGRIAENMEASLSIPVATSQRTIPVKVIDENRRIVNEHRTLLGNSKISYTHLTGWAVVQALKSYPNVNNAFIRKQGEPFRWVRNQINIGIAVDVTGKDGNRSLMVPNIKDADGMDFQQFLAAFDDIVRRARSSKLKVEDFQGTTISLTNPGTVGTVSSVPRLMPGQGAIIATGTIDYPAEYAGVTDAMRATLGVGKVMTLTCTYDHRIIQGAESGSFLAKIEELLQGGDEFYEKIFADLKMPYHPVRWEADRAATLPGKADPRISEIAKQAAVLQLINAYRVRGHLIADLDPLGSEPSHHAELDPATYGLSIWDLDREFLTGTLGEAMGGGGPQPVATLRQILETLRRTYCGKISCEYMNIQVPEQKRWLQHRMEPTTNNWPLDIETRRWILERLIEAEEFEHFLHARYIGHKRFSLEGGETAIAVLDHVLDNCADSGVHEVVIGMAHRGRITVLANVVGKDLKQIFSQFEENYDPTTTQGSGDVKYHLGATGLHRSRSHREIIVSVSPNPSHLEAVDPVVQGIVRPKQDRLGDTERKRVIPLLIHGDAAFAGQGVVAETLNLSQLDGYCTGGTIHLIINNQIGFTTGPEEARSTAYPTDVARMVQAPIFHVNGDDPEAAVRAAQLAFDYRQEFGKDVVIDMICYRRHGHNEADDPSYTQPILYRKIRQQPSVSVLYAERLAREGAITREEADQMRKRIAARFSQAFDEARKAQERFEVSELSAVDTEQIGSYCPRTAVSRETLERVVNGLTTFPSDFRLHPKLRGFIERRKEALNKDSVDWALGESLAWGSLVLEGTPARLSGQDSGRGTFSQRHLEYYDSEDGHQYIPLKHLSPDQARFEVWDSSLSEYAVMGFEFGYSVADPLTLVMWEAQFGDFANGAQIMIDQFIVAAEAKWGQPSGLVLLLPHGYEGQGPEHSSARIERFLTLGAEENIQVVNCTTPAQYFHVLRRQMYGGADRRGVRKPLIIFTPKSLLRHAKAVSAVQEFTAGGFREVLDDHSVPAYDRITRLLLCSGKIYYELLAAREEKKADHVAIIRIEQLYPFPQQLFRDVLMRYPLSADVFWVQEEPRNMGPWRFMAESIQPMLETPKRNLRYVGRQEMASPAPGSMRRHTQEQKEIIEDAFAPTPAARARSRTRRIR
ncbi:MAG TPA: multifunctional oxoglutarate decarboxylase/oxoglutarate dehydrogenase thiamine pyrophosphate-binding subunit/dihydrolipoyllysine-residue succinyltransferase subunit [Bryobacteraceae bacterium]|nr:multifunctional oxoglutarate decarboxylase/oxoglutarate dehydrogenase thiamine pyrophosphate-binding subunit/dihydrolipoyllysine-residue succinyltransferase subunit [Bryobacteraceae bacterium]